MIHLVSLLAAALLSLQCSLEVTAQVDSKINLDNHLQPNVIQTPKRRSIRKFVRIWAAPSETTRHTPGTSTELECVVMGKPAPAVQWLRNGEPVVDYEEESNDIMSTDPSSVGQLTSKLIITAAASGDVYTCVATAGLKQETASTTVYNVEDDVAEEPMTLEKLLRKPLKPIITSFYDSVFQNENTDIVLPCRIASNSHAQVFWQDNHKDLVYGDSRRRVLPSGDLLIKDLRWDDDMGEFSCISKNLYGKDTKTTFLYPVIVDRH